MIADRTFVVTFQDRNYSHTSEEGRVVHSHDSGLEENFKNNKVAHELTKDLPTQSVSKVLTNDTDEINRLSALENITSDDQKKYADLTYKLAYPLRSKMNNAANSVWGTFSSFQSYFGNLPQQKRKEISKLVTYLRNNKNSMKEKKQYYDDLLRKYENEKEFQKEIINAYTVATFVPNTGGSHTKKRRTRSNGRSKKRRY